MFTGWIDITTLCCKKYVTRFLLFETYDPSFVFSFAAKQRDFVSFAFIPLIHTDSSGEKAHLDNTLAYSIAFNSATST